MFILVWRQACISPRRSLQSGKEAEFSHQSLALLFVTEANKAYGGWWPRVMWISSCFCWGNDQTVQPAPSAGNGFPHLDFITLLKRSSELALPGHGRDGSTLDERWACARPCGGDVGYSYFSLWPPSQGALGAVGQVNQRAGNRLNIDVEGDKTVAPLNSEAFIDPG